MIIKTTIINDAGVIVSEKITVVESAPEKKTRAPRVTNGTATVNVAAPTTKTKVTLSANGKRMGRPPKAAAAPAPAPEKKARAKKAAAAKG